MENLKVLTNTECKEYNGGSVEFPEAPIHKLPDWRDLFIVKYQQN